MSRFQRCTTAGVFSLALIVGAVSPSYAQAPKPKNELSVAWSHSVEQLVDINISPQGRFIGLMTRSGKLSVWDASTGIPTWSIHGLTEHNVVVSDTGGDAAVYDAMNRLDRSVQVFGGKRAPNDKSGATVQTSGHRLTKAVMDGAIWSADASVDGSLFAFGDGARQVRLIALAPTPHALAPYPVDGIACDVSFSSDSQSVVAGLWNQSGVEALDRSGHIVTSYFGPNVRRFHISVSSDGGEILALATFIRQSDHPVASLLGSDGSVKWSYNPGEGTSDGNAVVGTSGQVSYVAYTKIVHRAGKGIESQRLLTALDGTGNELWIKGGPFVQPKLISLAPDGSSVIVYDNNHDHPTLYAFASDGSREARLVLPAELQQLYSVSRNNRVLILYLVDGTLERVDVS